MTDISLKNIIPQILNEHIPLAKVKKVLDTLADVSHEAISHPQLPTVLVTFINQQRPDLVKALLAKISIENFDNILATAEAKEEQGITIEEQANNIQYKHLRHYIIGEIFKTALTDNYQKDDFDFIISKFAYRLTDINFLQLLLMVKDNPEAFKIAASKILKSHQGLDLKRIIPYMVEYLNNPDCNLAGLWELFNSLHQLELITKQDLTSLVKSVTFNKELKTNYQVLQNTIKDFNTKLLIENLISKAIKNIKNDAVQHLYNAETIQTIPHIQIKAIESLESIRKKSINSDAIITKILEAREDIQTSTEINILRLKDAQSIATSSAETDLNSETSLDWLELENNPNLTAIQTIAAETIEDLTIINIIAAKINNLSKMDTFDSIENKAIIIAETAEKINNVRNIHPIKNGALALIDSIRMDKAIQAIKTLDLQQDFAQSFIRLPSKVTSEENASQDDFYFSKKVIDEFTSHNSSLPVWVKYNLASFIEILPESNRNSYFYNIKFLSELLKAAIPPKLITATLDTLLSSSTIANPANSISILRTLKEILKRDPNYLGLEWAINKLPLIDTSKSPTTSPLVFFTIEISKLLNTIPSATTVKEKTPGSSHSMLYQQNHQKIYEILIKHLDNLLADPTISAEKRDKLVKDLPTIIKEICHYTEKHNEATKRNSKLIKKDDEIAIKSEIAKLKLQRFSYLLSACQNTSILSKPDFLDAWLQALLTQCLEHNTIKGKIQNKIPLELYNESIKIAHQQAIDDISGIEIDKTIYGAYLKVLAKQPNLSTVIPAACPIENFGLLSFVSLLFTPNTLQHKELSSQKLINSLINLILTCASEKITHIDSLQKRKSAPVTIPSLLLPGLFSSTPKPQSKDSALLAWKSNTISAIGKSNQSNKLFYELTLELSKWILQENHNEVNILKTQVTNFLSLIEKIIEFIQNDSMLKQHFKPAFPEKFIAMVKKNEELSKITGHSVAQEALEQTSFSNSSDSDNPNNSTQSNNLLSIS